MLVAILIKVPLARDKSQDLQKRAELQREIPQNSPHLAQRITNNIVDLFESLSGSPLTTEAISWLNEAEDNRTPDELDLWIEKLAKTENCSPLGTPDNGSLSYGKFCFKKSTWQEQIRKYEMLPQAEWDELMNFIGEDELQTKLVRKMLVANPENWRHWWTSCQKIGKSPII